MTYKQRLELVIPMQFILVCGVRTFPLTLLRIRSQIIILYSCYAVTLS